MEVKRFFKLQDEFATFFGMCLVVDFDFQSKQFWSYDEFKKYIRAEFNDDKTVLQTACIYGGAKPVLRFMCLGDWKEYPIRIKTIE